MYSIAIETSCDETALALLESPNWIENNDSQNFLSFFEEVQVLSSVIHSQIEIHREYGGVVPELGAREHALHINFLLQQLLKKANKNLQFLENLENIFVTTKPGLDSALKVGYEFAKALKFYLKAKFNQKVKLYEVNHLHGHLFSVFFSFNNQFEEQDIEISAHQKNPSPNSTFLNLNHNKKSKKNLLKKTKTPNTVFPHLHLLVSGGHTQLFLLLDNQQQNFNFNTKSDLQNKTKNNEENFKTSKGNYNLTLRIVGQTLDDASGETLDKIGRMLGLPYPAGPKIAKIAGQIELNPLNLPIGMQKVKSLDFSFSGLKTAVRYLVQSQNFPKWSFEQELDNNLLQTLIQDSETGLKNNDLSKFVYQVCVSSQTVVITQLLNKLQKAIQEFKPRSLGLSGGVSANLLLRKKISELAIQKKIPFFPAPPELTGDNAVMIGLAGLINNYWKILE